ncbi:maleylpyruvate isomerase family mycothiol-dependent enzyme [Polymorphospora sp. NPDC050346]|uniref:maleylpyruvate isomerase family mycothiol-dependent enzyme n=1 Tax=Polymorphospora sp. NPDC050346 TaxID=3155780 RepID=UPI003405D6FF
MQNTRYLECLASDYRRLREVVSGGPLDAVVPSCPDWSMADLAGHVAHVYLHKTECIRHGAEPDPWPPELSGEEPVALLDRSYAALTHELTTRPPEAPAGGWYEPDQTVGFWIRRMAQETVVHRIDAELAAGVPSVTVPDDLAVDGIDEVLEVFLAYATRAWPEYFTELMVGNDGRGVIVAGGGSRWLVRLDRDVVTVRPAGTDEADARVSGDPAAVLRWLWRRVDDDAVRIEGEKDLVVRLRQLLGVATL